MKEVYLDQLNPEVYVALRAIWLLWRRGRWVQLEELGLTCDRFHAPFEAFSDKKTRIVNDHMTVQLLLSLPEALQDELLAAALVLAVTYAAYFNRREPEYDLSFSNQERRDSRRNRSRKGRGKKVAR
jgi:hypothetical protein